MRTKTFRQDVEKEAAEELRLCECHLARWPCGGFYLTTAPAAAASCLSQSLMVLPSNLFSLTIRARLRTNGGTASRACASFSASMMAHPLWVPALHPQSKFQR